MDISGTVRLIRETKGLTQAGLAEAAGVSLSSIRRLERDPDARFHSSTEEAIAFALGLRREGLAVLRTGADPNHAFRDGIHLHFGRSSRYREAPLSEIVLADSYVARLIARGLDDLGQRRSEELGLAAAGRLLPWEPGQGGDHLFDWMPWQARLLATPLWLDRLHDSAEQLSTVLTAGNVPRPLRPAELMLLHAAHDRAWALDTNGFFVDGEEITDGLTVGIVTLLGDLPDRVADYVRTPTWQETTSELHPHRWWEPWSD